MIQDIFIIGATGNVGSTLVRQIIELKDTDASIHTNPTRIVGLAGKDNCIYSQGGISNGDALAFASKKKRGEKGVGLDGILSIVSKHPSDGRRLVFVDATALNEEMLAFHKKVIGSTDFGIVTANKNPLAYSDFKTFNLLTREVTRYGFRCSVMAGAEAVSLMRDLRDLSDQPVSIEGCLSGTLGYLATQMQQGKSLSKVLGEAMKLGYTEPNPADDLNGNDVAKKILILSRSAGFPLGFSNVKLSPFVPEEVLKAQNVNELLESIRNYDETMAAKFATASKKGNTLRYVASLKVIDGKPLLEVGLREVGLQSPLGLLSGTSNKIVVTTGTYTSQKPYIVEAPGAGLDVTAQNIRRDLLEQLNKRIVK